MLWRARVSSFLAGVGVATLACMYQLKGDIDESFSLVLDAVRQVLMGMGGPQCHRQYMFDADEARDKGFG